MPGGVRCFGCLRMLRAQVAGKSQLPASHQMPPNHWRLGDASLISEHVAHIIDLGTTRLEGLVVEVKVAGSKAPYDGRCGRRWLQRGGTSAYAISADNYCQQSVCVNMPHPAVTEVPTGNPSQDSQPGWLVWLPREPTTAHARCNLLQHIMLAA
jgi:hypothetical protein